MADIEDGYDFGSAVEFEAYTPDPPRLL